MKKNLFILIASLFLSGSMFAQQYETHWPDFYLYDYQFHGDIVAAVKIDNDMITLGDDYASYEVGFFVNDVCRGHSFLCHYNYVSYPILQSACIYYDVDGDEVSFKLYDHANQLEYDICTSSVTVVTGTDYLYYNNPIILTFHTPTFTKSIIGYDNGGGWNLIASPLAGVTDAMKVTNLIDTVTLANCDLYRFNQNAELEWENWKQSGEHYQFNLENGNGYLYANANDVDLVFKGMPFTGTEKTVYLDYSEGTELAGWNLVGNPFTMRAYIVGGKPFYTMSGDHMDIVPATPDMEGIEAMEGIFVVAETDGEELTFSTERPELMPSSLALNVTQGHGIVDRAIVRFDEGGTLPKFQLFKNSTKVYIPMDDKDYAVVSSEDMGELPVNFKAESNDNYTLNFSNTEVTFSYLHLIDNMNGNDIDLLTSPSYTFYAKVTDYESRFKLVFATGNATEDNFAFFSNGSFIINNNDEATLQVVDVMGRILSSETINGSVSKVVNAAPGIYMLRLIKGNDMKVQKIVIG